MAEETGLRFDLYERVRLPEELPAIGELEQMELVPFVRQASGEDGTTVKGHLQLTVVYAPEGDGAMQRTFTHRIPVDISLPTRSVTDEGDIRLDIEQLDIELLSSRSLNVTGLLSLAGLTDRPADQQAARQEDSSADDQAAPDDLEADEAVRADEEEIVAIHQAKAKGKAKKKETTSDQVKVVPGNVPAAGPLPMPVPPSQHAKTPVGRPGPNKAGLLDDPEDEPEHDADKTVSASPQTGPPDNDGFDDEWPPSVPASAPMMEGESMDADGWLEDDDIRQRQEQQAEAEQSATEPKVAFKPFDDTSEDGEESAQAHAAAGTRNNELDWQRLFLARAEEDSFRKVRMCIVQKEETIESIAARYNLNPREIALYNRLTDNGLEEGQILDIPLP